MVYKQHIHILFNSYIKSISLMKGKEKCDLNTIMIKILLNNRGHDDDDE